MSIQTIEDWNRRLRQCGCCEMPVLSPPEIDVMRTDAWVRPSGHFASDPAFPSPFDLSAWVRWQRHRRIGTQNDTQTSSGTTGAGVEWVDASTWAFNYERVSDYGDTIQWSSFAGFGGAGNLPEVNYYGGGTFTNTYTEDGVVVRTTAVTSELQDGGGPAGSPTPLWTFTEEFEEPPASPVITSFTNSLPFFGTAPVAYTPGSPWAFSELVHELPMSWAQFVSSAEAKLDQLITAAVADVAAWSEDALFSSGDGSRYAHSGSTNPYPQSYTSDFIFFEKRAMRFRFKIPVDHTGSWMRILYDVAEFPSVKGPDPSWVAPDPSLVSQDHEVIWSGPGNQGDPDHDSWFTDWQVLEPPAIMGTRRIVNLRYEHYQGTRLGIKPCRWGERWPAE
jgi:hypothetical protein